MGDMHVIEMNPAHTKPKRMAIGRKKKSVIYGGFAYYSKVL
jgi:hypothetical protein